MLYRDSLTAHQFTPSVPTHLEYISNERQWLLISNETVKVAFLHAYIACQTTRSDDFLQWNEDLFFLLTLEAKSLKQRGFIVMCLGDFNTRVGNLKGLDKNTPDTNRNSPMFFTFLKETNLLIMNTLPVARGLFTRFMDSSGRPGTKSLLDYGLIDHDFANTVTSFVIDEEARYEAGSDHALLQCLLEFGARPKIKWAFHEAIHYNITDRTSFTDYQSCLDIEASAIPLHKFSELPTDQMLPHISESLNTSAKKIFGLKIKKKKRGQALPKTVISLIRNKNDLVHKLNASKSNMTLPQINEMETEIESLKTLIKENITTVKIQRRAKLRSKLLHADPSRKRFWRFLKHNCKSAGQISAVNNQTETMVFEQHEIEDAILKHFEDIFSGQRVPVYSQESNPDQVALSSAELDQILGNNTPVFTANHFENKVCARYTYKELEDILKQLPTNKASGYDCIPNELLQNASPLFKQYLLLFLNRILDDGIVPQQLNTGKCMLIHKV